MARNPGLVPVILARISSQQRTGVDDSTKRVATPAGVFGLDDVLVQSGKLHVHIRYTRGPMTRRVLLVGGDSGAVTVCRDVFRGFQRDYQVETADYCDDALTLLMRRSFDVVLVLSLRAPWRKFPGFAGNVESGILFLKEMHALHSHVPAIVVSASIDLRAKEAAFANGAFAFIEKPMHIEELDRLVALALTADRQGPPGE